MEEGKWDWVVCVTDGAVAEIGEIAERLRAMGADMSRVLGDAGVIGCRCTGATAERIRGIAGVAAVEPEMRAGPRRSRTGPSWKAG